ncbi:universal stress protein [Luteimonas sp. e5]
MSASACPKPPAAILLATDLSARSDRAFDRALQLAEQWKARLVLLTVLPQESSFSRPNHYQRDDEDEDDAPTVAELVEERIRAELPDTPVEIDVRVEAPGHVGQAAARVAAETGCGLIVTGIARSDSMQRIAMGSTLVWLSRHAEIPVLAVQQRPRGPYQRMLVASDLSDSSATALRVASGWFAQLPSPLLLHAGDMALREMTSGNAAQREAAAAQARDEAGKALKQWRDEVLPAAQAKRWRMRVEISNPIRLLRQAALDENVQLAVIASHGRTRLADALIGSVAKRLLETAITDMLIVRG